MTRLALTNIPRMNPIMKNFAVKRACAWLKRLVEELGES